MIILFYILILFVPGLIAALAYEISCGHRIKCCTRFFYAALIFDLLIQIYNLFWIRFIKQIESFDALKVYFNCLSFTTKFAILSVILGIIFGVLAGLVCRGLRKKLHCCRDEE